MSEANGNANVSNEEAAVLLGRLDAVMQAYAFGWPFVLSSLARFEHPTICKYAAEALLDLWENHSDERVRKQAGEEFGNVEIHWQTLEIQRGYKMNIRELRTLSGIIRTNFPQNISASGAKPQPNKQAAR